MTPTSIDAARPLHDTALPSSVVLKIDVLDLSRQIDETDPVVVELASLGDAVQAAAVAAFDTHGRSAVLDVTVYAEASR